MTSRPDAPGPAGGHDRAGWAMPWRERWESAQDALRTRFEDPVEHAAKLTRRTLAWFPVRVWRHYLRHNGFLLAAGVSYQALFAIFSVIYLAFASVGLWLGANGEAIARLIDIINDYIPNLISEAGLVSPEQVDAVAAGSANTLGATGAIALVIVVWTAIGFITFARRAVRDIFGLPFDPRSYLLLKARDLLAAFVFALALLIGAAVASVATWALGLLFSLLGLSDLSAVSNGFARAASLLVSFAINGSALAGMFRFLTGAALTWRRIWPGSLLGGGALVLLQVGAGLLLSYTPSNPLLATFAVLIGFLLWFRLNSVVILVSAAWIAVAAADRHLELARPTAQDQARAEHQALLVAARVRVRDARRNREQAPWFGLPRARRRLRRAEMELRRIEASAPSRARGGGVSDL